ncbi:unnamed protein product [Chrysoparadoxa australica]
MSADLYKRQVAWRGWADENIKEERARQEKEHEDNIAALMAERAAVREGRERPGGKKVMVRGNRGCHGGTAREERGGYAQLSHISHSPPALTAQASSNSLASSESFLSNNSITSDYSGAGGRRLLHQLASASDAHDQGVQQMNEEKNAGGIPALLELRQCQGGLSLLTFTEATAVLLCGGWIDAETADAAAAAAALVYDGESNLQGEIRHSLKKMDSSRLSPSSSSPSPPQQEPALQNELKLQQRVEALETQVEHLSRMLEQLLLIQQLGSPNFSDRNPDP